MPSKTTGATNILPQDTDKEIPDSRASYWQGEEQKKKKNRWCNQSLTQNDYHQKQKEKKQKVQKLHKMPRIMRTRMIDRVLQEELAIRRQGQTAVRCRSSSGSRCWGTEKGGRK
jgi:hypothetical protein